MDSAAKESLLSEHLSERLGGLILKDEQKLALEALMSGKDVLSTSVIDLAKLRYRVTVLQSKDSHYL